MTWSVFAPDAASALLTVLTILLFAVLVEYGRWARYRTATGQPSVDVKVAMVLAIVSWGTTSLLLLAAINGGGLKGHGAEATWGLTGLCMVLLFGTLIFYSTRMPRTAAKPRPSPRPHIRPGLAERRKRR